MTSADRLRLEESALQYALAIREAISQHRRSGNMHLVDASYTVYNLTRMSRNGISPPIRTSANYAFTGVTWVTDTHKRLQWEIFDRFTLMDDLETKLPETRLLLGVFEDLLGVTPEEGMRSVKMLCGAVFGSTGRAPSARQVRTVVQQLLPTLAGEAVSCIVKAEINGVWPECAVAHLMEDVKMGQLWSVQYRTDLDSLTFVSGRSFEDIPDASITVVRNTADPRGIEGQLRVLIRVLTLFGPHRVTLVRSARSQPGTTSLLRTSSASDRLGGSGHGYCIRRSQMARCRGFVRRILPLLAEEPGSLPEGSMHRIALTSMTLLDEGLERHSDTASAIAYKIVCLESLYLEDDETSGISYRLRNRVAGTLAELLGSDARQTITDVKDAYAVRSGFFHGHVRPDVLLKATPELDARIGDYCRASVAAFLQCGEYDRRQFLRNLDAGMVSTHARQELWVELLPKHFSLPLTAADCGEPH